MSEARFLFLSEARQRLLFHLMSPWHRRGTTLLQIGLNSGVSPEFFWEAGFDVTATDYSPDCLKAASMQIGSKVEYACTRPEALPFEDGEFDYAVLLHHGLRGAKGNAILLEARRVAARGILIVEWNKCSLAGVPETVRQHQDGDGNFQLSCSSCKEEMGGVLPWALYFLARKNCESRRIHTMFTLPLWEGSWPDGADGCKGYFSRMLAPINLFLSPVPLGALMGMRMDWTPISLTPIGLLRSAAARLCPATQTPAMDSQREALNGG